MVERQCFHTAKLSCDRLYFFRSSIFFPSMTTISLSLLNLPVHFHMRTECYSDRHCSDARTPWIIQIKSTVWLFVDWAWKIVYDPGRCEKLMYENFQRVCLIVEESHWQSNPTYSSCCPPESNWLNRLRLSRDDWKSLPLVKNLSFTSRLLKVRRSYEGQKFLIRIIRGIGKAKYGD